MKKTLLSAFLVGFTGMCHAMNEAEIDQWVGRQLWYKISKAVGDGLMEPAQLCKYEKAALDLESRTTYDTLCGLLLFRTYTYMERRKDDEQAGPPCPIPEKKHTAESRRPYECLKYLIIMDKITHNEDLAQKSTSCYPEKPSPGLILYNDMLSNIKVNTDDIENAQKSGCWKNVARRIASGNMSKAYLNHLSDYDKAYLAKAALAESTHN